MKSPLSFIVVVVLTLAIPFGAGAQSEITLLSPDPIKATIDKLVGDFEAKSGIQVKITYGTGVSTRKTVASGQALDVSLLFAPFAEALQTGNIVPGSATVSRDLPAIAVQKGALARHFDPEQSSARRWCGPSFPWTRLGKRRCIALVT